MARKRYNCFSFPQERHLALLTRCGICRDEIGHNEKVVVSIRLPVLSNAACTSFEHLLGPFRFPDPDEPSKGPRRAVDGFFACIDASCHCWENSRDCCKLYLRHCQAADKLSRLWTAACWRNVWSKNTPIPWIESLPPRTTPAAAGLVGSALDVQRVEQWMALPPELLLRIHFLSRGAPLWRCIAAMELADIVDRSKPEALTEVPLSQITTWQREGGAEQTSEAAGPVFRIRIDDVGISHIDRVLHEPHFAGHTKQKNIAWIILTSKEAERVSVQFKDHIARLKLSGDFATPRICDTPEPINLDCIHTWTKLRGDMIYGPLVMRYSDDSDDPEAGDEWEAGDKVLNEGTCISLICDTSVPTNVLKSLGAYCQNPRWGDVRNQTSKHASFKRNKDKRYESADLTPFRAAQPRRIQITVTYSPQAAMMLQTYYASVTLDKHCCSAEVFEWGGEEGARYQHPQFAGAIFRFEDGSAQAVGQCRVGLDPSVTYRDPAHILWKLDAEANARRLSWGIPPDPADIDPAPLGPGVQKHLRRLRFEPAAWKPEEDPAGPAWDNKSGLWNAKPLGKRLDFWWSDEEVSFSMDGIHKMGPLEWHPRGEMPDWPEDIEE
ncbi:hypothetical protein PG997_006783 [Apiospora hydei]|uniref:F-box domain-containing protein n=1 Tax=Apiospora hydei TaxID=1337664 RepID=A0ABR1WPW1_9PEZI